MLVSAALGVAVGVSATLLARRGSFVRRASGPDGAGPAPAAAPAPARRGDLAAQVLDGLELGIAIVDDDYAVRMSNPSIARFELVVDGWVDPRLIEVIGEARRAGPVRREFELDPNVRHQEPRAVEVTATAFDRDGHSYVGVLVEDITDAHRLDAVRRDFVANVSHELKTPVGALSLLAETLFAAADDPDAVAHFAGQVQREAARLAAVVADLIELSRLQGAEPLQNPEPVPVRRLLAEVMDRARVTAATAGIVLVGAEPGDAAVMGSERQLVTAIGNLVDNAIAYSARGTKVALGVRTDMDAAARSDGTRVGRPIFGPWVEISVSDQGVGIADSDLERIFERFYRVDPARSRATGGTGLGLSIVKHIVTNHGGTVAVWSVEGAGSTFTVRLPRAGAIPSSSIAPAVALPARGGHSHGSEGDG